MAGVRKLEPADLPRVTQVFRRVFTDVPAASDEALTAYFRRIYFDHPWTEDRVSSLVYETQGEGVVGFLGVTPRPLIFRDAQILAAVTSTFMIDPDHRGPMAAISLLKSCFEGPQDLTIAEGNDLSRKLWQALGGVVAPAYSAQWVCPVRPVGYALSHIGLPVMLGSLVDPLMALSRRGPFTRREAKLREEELSVSVFLEEIGSLGGSVALRPAYSPEDARWLFDLLARKKQYGRFKKTLLRADEGSVAGWYLWYQKRRDIARVAQIVSRDEMVWEVLLHLVHRAMEAGALAVSGRLEPQLMGHVARLGALFGRGFGWMLVHSREPDIQSAIQAGDALFTRLEGEWWLHFAEE